MKLKDLVKIIELKIPDTDVVVKMKEELSWYEYQESFKVTDLNERGIFILSKMVQSWNIEGDDGQPLPITPDSIRDLPKKVVQPLVAKANEITSARSEKKKS
jgi:hypothetical protein